MPKISVLTIVRNAEKCISTAINSVLNQSFADFEYIIIDDESTDNTPMIVNSFSDKRIKFIRAKHDYIANLNMGIDLAKGEYIARIDADDFMHSDRLLIQLKRLQKFPEIDVCSTYGTLIEPGKPARPIYDSNIANHIFDPLTLLLKVNFIIHSSVLIKRKFLMGNNCYYSDRFAYCEDYDLWVQIAKKGGHFYVEPQILTAITKHEEQVTSIHSKAMRANSIKLRTEILKYIIRNKFSSELESDQVDNLLNFAHNRDIDPNKIFNFYYDFIKVQQ